MACLLHQKLWSKMSSCAHMLCVRFSMWPEAPSAISQVPPWPTAPPRHPPPHTANSRPSEFAPEVARPRQPDIYASEMHAYEMHARKIHACEIHTHQIHAR